jgi:ADP-ribose pyrophosphatase
MMHHDRRVEIRGRHRLLNDFFKLDEVTVAHQRYDGTMSAGERRLVFERGDAIAVLLFDKQTRSVLAVEQFSLPALIARRRDNPTTSDAWITELVAGMIDEGESATQAVMRETFEETGYRIENPKPIGTYFSSPGGLVRALLSLLRARERGAARGQGGGLAGEEDIKVFQIAVEDLFDQPAAGTIEDPKLAIAGYWLKYNIDRL